MYFNLFLGMQFSVPVKQISLDFALNTSSTTIPLDLLAYSGVIILGSAGATGTIPSGFAYPEGVLSFTSSTPFSSIFLSTTAQDFAVDNVTVNTTIPEPCTALLIGSGLAGLSALRKKLVA